GLARWACHVPSLTTWGIAPVTRKVSTCTCFVLISISLWFSRTKDNRVFGGIAAMTAKISAVMAGVTSLLSLAEKIFPGGFGVDQVVGSKSSATSAAWGSIGLMSPLTAISFLLL